MKSKIANWFRLSLIPFAVATVYRFWSGTWRVTVNTPPEVEAIIRSGKPFVFALWHGDEIALMRFARLYRVATMASTSKDGDLMNAVLERFGFATSRGSSTRGGARALLGLVRLVQNEKRGAVVTVDGPKGPLHVPKPGVFELSKHLDAPIIPGGVSCSRAFIFKKSWNQAYLPLPFARVHLEWAVPLASIPRDADTRQSVFADQLRRNLEEIHGVARAKLDLK